MVAKSDQGIQVQQILLTSNANNRKVSIFEIPWVMLGKFHGDKLLMLSEFGGS